MAVTSSSSSRGMTRSVLHIMMRVVRKTIVILALTSVTIGLLSMLPFAPSFIKVNESSVNPRPLQVFRGSLEENDILSKETVKLHHKEIIGPETLQPHQGYLYFGVNDGRILRMSLTSPSYEYDVVLNSTYVFPGDRTCSYSGPADQANCGRHLGIRFDSKGKFMYSLDAYTGIYKTDLKTKVVSRIFDEKTRGIDRRIVFLDDFVTDEAANGGNIHYITDSSANWPVDYCGPIVLLKDTTGRLLKFDEETQTVEVLMESLTFPNGIELSDDKQSVIFNELGKRMTWRHYIKGAKKGKSEVICDNLPGYPDNLRRSARKDRETYWIAFYEASNPEKPNHLVSFLEKNPRIVEFTSRLFFNVGKMVMDVGVMFSFQPLIDTGFYIKTTQFHQKFLDFSSRGLAIEVDINCNILRSIHSPEGRVTHLSEIREVLEGNGQSTLYLGSYYNDYLGKLTLHDR